MLLFHLCRIGPAEIAPLMKPGIEVENLRRRAEAMVRSEEGGRAGSAQGDDLGQEPIDLAEVFQAQVPDLDLHGRGRSREKFGIQEAPAEMLELIDAVKENGGKLAGLLAPQITEG